MPASVAPAVSAARAAPGEPTTPFGGRAGPSLPAGATTSVPSLPAPRTACASGESPKPAYGALTPTSATRTASSTAPSPFGSTARSSPAISVSLVPWISGVAP